jgi:outer membrane cobalamin receptor
LTTQTRRFCSALVLSLFSCVSLICAGQEQKAKPDSLHAENPAGSSAAAPCLPRSIENKEVIVVTGTFEPLSLEDLNRSVSIFETRDTRLLYNHWVDYLGMDPSIDFRQRAPNDVQADISIRGSSFGQTLVMVNGLRMDDAQSGHHDVDLPLPTASFDRIEVLRGAGSTLYGSDAMAGVVNLITARPSAQIADRMNRSRRPKHKSAPVRLPPVVELASSCGL